MTVMLSLRLLLIKLYKKFSIKCNPKQNITFLSSIAHGFFYVITADMKNDLKESHTRRPLPPIKNSHQSSFMVKSVNKIQNTNLPILNETGLLLESHKLLLTK